MHVALTMLAGSRVTTWPILASGCHRVSRNVLRSAPTTDQVRGSARRHDRLDHARSSGSHVLDHLVGTAEVLIVERGQCEVDIYTDDRRLVATRTLNEHDIMISVGGGHGFRATQDLVLLESSKAPIPRAPTKSDSDDRMR